MDAPRARWSRDSVFYHAAVKGLGQRIRSRRHALALRQHELAERLGVTPQTVSKWELDAIEPGLAHLEDLAQALASSADWLLGIGERLADGRVIVIGARAARVRSRELGPAGFARWCQDVLACSVGAIESAGGKAVTARGPGIIAAFGGEDRDARAWRAIAAAARVQETPLKIGSASGQVRMEEMRVGRQTTHDVFGEPVSAALALAEWVAGRPASPREHLVAWQGYAPASARPDALAEGPEVGGARIGRVAMWRLRVAGA